MSFCCLIFVFCFVFLHLFFQTKEDEVSTLSENLKNLAKGLPELLLNAKSDKTVQKYYYGFNKWAKWAKTNSLSIFPVKPLHLCLFCNYLISVGTSQSVLTEVFYSIRWAHYMVGESSPTDSC